MRLAVVEEDQGVGDALAEALSIWGYEVDHKRTGAELLDSYGGYDAVILDLGLPDMDGMQVLRRLRAVSTMPVVILSRHADERSIVRGLRCGADDYMVKPARIPELVARLEAASRRAATPGGPTPHLVSARDVQVDLLARQVEVSGAPVTLTHKEFELLRILVERPGSAVSRRQLVDRLWGGVLMEMSRALDVHIAALRAKIDRPGLIATVRGYGYRWEG
ncbi:response regulator transcription factor [Nocardia sp. NPDC052566]|uniref:response regulator transcription factor n=1 Tax=Nocardia sp. NPDC052566 TaxID=3364330 RepID=UPI0037CCA5B4